MKGFDSKLLVGFIVGAAIGAAIGYVAAADKKELLEDLNGVADKIKEGFNAAVSKYKQSKTEAINE